MPAVIRGVFRQPESSIRRRSEEVYDGSMVVGTLPAVNRVVGPIDTAGYQVAAIQIGGTFSGTVVVEHSNDGVTWYAGQLNNIISGVVSASVTTAGLFFCQIAGRYMRVRCSAYTSGTVNVSVALRVGMAEGQQVVISGTPNVAVPAGVLNLDGLFFDETNTVLGAGATLTGATRDTGVAAAASVRYKKFGALVFSDQAGTLRLENSRDGSTWRRSSADVALAANAVAGVEVPVAARYNRMVYVNGATLQTIFQPQTYYQ